MGWKILKPKMLKARQQLFLKKNDYKYYSGSNENKPFSTKLKASET